MSSPTPAASDGREASSLRKRGTATSSEDEKNFYRLPMRKMTPELFGPQVPTEKWLQLCETSSSASPSWKLNEVDEGVPLDVMVERSVGMTLYFFLNAFPFFAIVIILVGIAAYRANSSWVLSVFTDDDEVLELMFGITHLAWVAWKFCAAGVFVYLSSMTLLMVFVFIPHFRRQYKAAGMSTFVSPVDVVSKKENATDRMLQEQYAYTEYHNSLYISLSVVWPSSCHRPALEKEPCIYCVAPHGLAPLLWLPLKHPQHHPWLLFQAEKGLRDALRDASAVARTLGITCYPLWSKLFADRLCRWLVAPVVMKLPVVGSMLQRLGYLPAGKKHIVKCLEEERASIGICLDGVAGMFEMTDKKESLYVKKRKGIIKIALQCGAPIVPVYAFGHTQLYTVKQDPFGFLRTVSVKLDASVSPFFGRFGWFMGPAKRDMAVAMCLGDPLRFPKMENPTTKDIDEWHHKLLKAYEDVFETHKAAFGWEEKALCFV
ncbi:unnamed protein product [Amoebophrya sp. A25]|nr:unnamed protein product [Amoebophrya sp. A25]|eukprot:GSA25T00023113001.1